MYYTPTIICPTIGWVFKIGNFKHTLLKDRKLIQKKKNIKKKSGYVFPETHVPLYCETVVHIIQRRKMPKATRMNSKPNVPICSEPVPGAGRTLGTDKTPKKQCTDPPIMQCGNQALVSPGIEKTPRT